MANRSFFLKNFLERLKWRIKRGPVSGFNSYDHVRIEQIGPDRGAAEWIVRCEGKIRFDRSPVIDDFNVLQNFLAEHDLQKESGQIRLVYIDATDSCITNKGCVHFDGLRHLKELRLVRCNLLTDGCLQCISKPEAVANCLQQLHIESCPFITERGITHLTGLRVLKTLTLQDLRWVDKNVLDHLRSGLPNCQITFI